jgi:hypothetical protein
MLALLFTSFVYAGTSDPRLHGCWFGAVANGKIEIVLSKNKKIADALWFDDGQPRLLADLSCTNKLPVSCTLSDDGGKFELRMAKKTQARMKFKGQFVRDLENEEPRVAIRAGTEESMINLVKMSESRCQEETKELFKIFGVGP